MSLTANLPQSKTKKILVVDDEIDIVPDKLNQFFEREIQQKEYELLYAASGQEALEIIDDTQIDLILLDLIMPPEKLDGFSLLARLEEKKIFIKVAILTGYETLENLKTAIRASHLVCDSFSKTSLHREGVRENLKRILEMDFTCSATNGKESNLASTQKGKNPRFSTVVRLAKSLPQSQSYELVSQLIENFTWERVEELFEALPSLTAVAKEEMEKKAQLEREDRERVAQGKVSLILLKKGTIEVKSHKMADGRLKNYYVLRWRDDTKKLCSRSLTEADLAEPQVRQIVESKLGKAIQFYPDSI